MDLRVFFVCVCVCTGSPDSPPNWLKLCLACDADMLVIINVTFIVKWTLLLSTFFGLVSCVHPFGC